MDIDRCGSMKTILNLPESALEAVKPKIRHIPRSKINEASHRSVEERIGVRKWSVDLDKLIYSHVVLIGLPTIFYYCLRVGGFSLTNLHMVIATFFILSSVMIIVEATNALFRRYAVPNPKPANRLDRLKQTIKANLGLTSDRPCTVANPLPRCTILVAAYLPNEQDIIVETLHHILATVNRPADGLELILAYNTPIDLPIEDELRNMAQHFPELCLLRVEGSRSKAENLNAALDIATGEIVCILDADHHPAADCFDRAWYWLEQGYDVVQGRNVIRNHQANLLTQNIAVEFEANYGVSHQAKSFLTDSTIFGGSNGYWRASVLKRIRFNPARMTEDIDATMRTLLSGYRIVHDRSIITTELAPANFSSFWFQRKRWAQGWLEVSCRYQRRVWRSCHFTPWQKIYWTYLLYYCVVYSLIALQMFPLLLSMLLYYGEIPQTDNPYLWFSTFITFFSGIYLTAVTMKIASVPYPRLYFVQHAAFIFFFTILKNMISVVGMYDYLSGDHQWVVTPRGQQKPRNVTSPTSALPAGIGLSTTKP